MAALLCRQLGEIADAFLLQVRVVDGGGTRQVYKDALRFVHKSLTQFPNFNYRGKLAGVLPMHGVRAELEFFRSDPLRG